MIIHREAAIRKMTTVVVKTVRDGYVVGLGSGSTVTEFVKILSSYIQHKSLAIRIVPSSLQIQMMAEQAALRVEELNQLSKIDLTVDGADQVDQHFNLIKGGGGALFRERILMTAAQRTIILVDETKFVERLNKPVPIEVSPFARSFVVERLKCMDGYPRIRVDSRSYPSITENGNIIIDTDFGIINDPAQLEARIKNIPGVIEVGIFTTHVNTIYKACGDGSIVKFSVKKT
jgi:ribose 5-phosphate isomerase A